MSGFISGFVSGFVCKTYLSTIILKTLYYFYDVKKKKDAINRIEFVCKIKGKYTDDIQPYWDYNREKKLIKIDLTRDLIEQFNTIINTEFTELFDLRDIAGERLITLFMDYFTEIGETYIYVNYTLNNKDYINVYRPGDTVSHTDFKYTKDKPKIICGYIKHSKIEYVTEYIRMYGNNDYITPEILVLGNDLLNPKDDKYTLNIIYPNGIKKYLYNEVI